MRGDFGNGWRIRDNGGKEGVRSRTSREAGVETYVIGASLSVDIERPGDGEAAGAEIPLAVIAELLRDAGWRVEEPGTRGDPDAWSGSGTR